MPFELLESRPKAAPQPHLLPIEPYQPPGDMKSLLLHATFKHWYGVHAKQMWGPLRGPYAAGERARESPTKIEAVAAGRAHASATMTAARDEAREETSFGWNAIMEVVSIFDEELGKQIWRESPRSKREKFEAMVAAREGK